MLSLAFDKHLESGPVAGFPAPVARRPWASRSQTMLRRCILGRDAIPSRPPDGDPLCP